MAYFRVSVCVVPRTVGLGDVAQVLHDELEHLVLAGGEGLQFHLVHQRRTEPGQVRRELPVLEELIRRHCLVEVLEDGPQRLVLIGQLFLLLARTRCGL
jgi:hypothetical protein